FPTQANTARQLPVLLYGFLPYSHILPCLIACAAREQGVDCDAEQCQASNELCRVLVIPDFCATDDTTAMKQSLFCLVS
uniref:hypothetical protein n=1 Tax=Vibrio cholerae TaxID=666 RepID=UPI001B3BF9E2